MMQRPWEIKFKDKQPLGKVSIASGLLYLLVLRVRIETLSSLNTNNLSQVRRILQPSHGLSYMRELGSGSDLYDDVIVRNKVDTVTKVFQ